MIYTCLVSLLNTLYHYCDCHTRILSHQTLRGLMDGDCLWGGSGDGVGMGPYCGYVISPRIEDA